jgi:hypothetical protein
MKLIHMFEARFTVPVLAASTFFLVLLTPARAEQEERFASPGDAINALTNAALNKDTNAMQVIFGPALRELMSADAVQASNGLVNFALRVSQKAVSTNLSPSSVKLEFGVDSWPFPIPLVNRDGVWFFDTAAGREEILNRRIGRNELNTIEVCRAYATAQREYASMDHSGSGVLEYAQKLRSDPGTHDGLYWHAEPGEPMSPLGPLIAQAHGEGYRHDTKIMGEKQVPYHGYFFKILTRQGSHAPGGRYSYVINGHMIAGFALVAWPDEWGNTGVMTFIINQQGKIYECNLGPKTASTASSMTTYDPGPLWKPVSN